MDILRFNISGAEIKCVFQEVDRAIPELSAGRRCILLLDEQLNNLNRNRFASYEHILISGGEKNKVQSTVDSILKELLRREADKEILLIGVGGGVVTDITGFVASIYKRGVSFLLLPTTLLGMVDAALGGKNGVNLGMAKNMVGTIYQPEAIVFDFQLLKTLPAIEWESGMAEIIKHACIADADMFAQLEGMPAEFYLHHPESLEDLVRKNVILKMNIVIKDIHDRADRLLLNFGHTLGHALENISRLPHGHAISIGMLFATGLSVQLKGLPMAEMDRIKHLLRVFRLPVRTDIALDRIFNVLLLDKRRSNDTIRFVLLSSLGHGEVQPIQLDQLKQHLKSFL